MKSIVFATFCSITAIISVGAFISSPKSQKLQPTPQHHQTTEELSTIHWLSTRRSTSRHLSSSSSENLPSCKIGDLLSDLPTPSLLLELSLAEKAVGEDALDPITLTSDCLSRMEGALFVHTQVVDTTARDTINQQQGSGSSTVIGELDVPYDLLQEGGAFLGIGLANHHVGGYYWARGMGIGASLPAHGIEVRPCSSNKRSELYWLKRGPGLNAQETTEESSNSNDGKRSEWADFLVAGDTVQLVPKDTASMLLSSEGFETLIGVRRIGRPLGADPIVEQIWVRTPEGWVVPTVSTQ